MSEPISTGCTAIDELLGGGLCRGVVTQAYGPPAAGKTNLALVAGIEAAAAGETVLYIDTEGLSLARLEQIAHPRAGDNSDALISQIIISEVYNFDEQEQAVRDAADLAERAALIILDSATGFYRLERTTQAEGEALRRVARQITHLLSLARQHDLAVLITNQVFTDPDADRPRPLGGHTLAHWPGIIVRIDRFRGGQRRATLEKHVAKAAGDHARFRIADGGLETVKEI